MTIDVWMQHPTARFLRSDMLASLRRWTGGSIPDTEIPIEATIAAMDAADVDFGLLSAWRGPGGQDLISNDEVAEWIGCIRTGLPAWRPSTSIVRWRRSASCGAGSG